MLSPVSLCSFTLEAMPHLSKSSLSLPCLLLPLAGPRRVLASYRNVFHAPSCLSLASRARAAELAEVQASLAAIIYLIQYLEKPRVGAGAGRGW